MNKKITGRAKSCVTHVFLIIFAFIQVYPLFWLFEFSLKDNSEIFGGNIAGLPKHWRFENYVTAFFKANVIKYFFNSVLVTGITIAVTLIVSAMSAYAISRMIWKGRDASLIIPYIAFGLPMAIYLFTSFMESLPKEMEEAAAIDGCGIYRMFMLIVFPLIRPAVATVSIFTFISSWNELMFAVTFINKAEFKTLTVGIMSMVGAYTTKWGEIGAGLMIATIPTVIMYLLLSEQVQKSLVAGAVKG